MPWPTLSYSGRAGLLVASLLLTGCHTLYRNSGPTFVPLSAYVPLLPRAGAELALTAGSLGMEGQAAGAPVAGVVVTAQGQLYLADRSRDVFRAGEVGFGITPWNSAGRMLGLLAGGGGGRGSSFGARYETWTGFNNVRYDSADWQTSAAYRTLYLMPVAGWQRPDARLEYAVAAKVYWINYRRLDYTERYRRGDRRFSSVSQDTTYTTTTRQRDVGRLHVQLTAQLAFGLTPQLWAQVRVGADVDTQRRTRLYNYPPIVISAGLRYRFGQLAPFSYP